MIWLFPYTQAEQTWETFTTWLNAQTEVQFDIETNVTSFWCTKKIHLMQFGNVEGSQQFVLDFRLLNEEQKQFLRDFFRGPKLKIIQNAAFEYIVLRLNDFILHNIYCTMVAEKLIHGGAETGPYSLVDLTVKYCSVNLSKELQTSFDGLTPWTREQLEYAANDVKYLSAIRQGQLVTLRMENLELVCKLEMQSLVAFSWCTVNGVMMDVPKWRENVALAEPVIQNAHATLNKWLLEDSRLLAKALELGYLNREDTVAINLNAPKQKLELLQLVFPDIPGASKPILKKFIRDNPELDPKLMFLLVDLQEGLYNSFIQYLVTNFKQVLIERGYLIPAGTVTINWNSVAQVLPLLQGVEPKLKSLAEESVANTTHPVFTALAEYKDSLKLTSSYGEEFLMKFIEPDGRVRTNYNPLVTTGRSSSSRPNMQNIPAKESVGTRYRNCFIYQPGWKFVDSDYTGQELALIAFASNDDVWYKAIERGEDLHSVTAAMVYGHEWEIATDDHCDFRLYRQKCKCKKHKLLRNAIKTINFG